MKIKTGGKVVIIGIIAATSAYGLNLASNNGYFSTKKSIESSVPERIDLPNNNTVPSVKKDNTELTKVNIAPVTKGEAIRLLTIPWNATLGLMYANGGERTTKDSMLAKVGINLTIERQNMYDQMIAEQVTFAKQISEGIAHPDRGAHFVIIMGDGFPAYVAGAQEVLQKYGQQIEVIAAIGYSRGEDKCMLPPEVKTNPQKARGSLIGAVLRDGDWNICVKWAGDNNIPVNPDEKTYDESAMNFVAVDDFTKADENYIAGYCENRPVVNKGKLTGEKKRVCQNGTATWTPGDVKIAREKGGIIPIASTKEYLWQMPTTIIGNKQWNRQNKQLVENLLNTVLIAGERVKNEDEAMTKAAVIAAEVFKEEDGAYWKKYHKGVVETDKTGNKVELGGSLTIGLADNAYLFGLNGNYNLYKNVYEVFGKLANKYYPDVMPKVIPYDQVVNTTYLESLLSKATTMAAVDKPVYEKSAPITGLFAAKSYSIEFDFNQATFTPAASVVLEDMLNQLAVSGLDIQIEGHTDATGNPQGNLLLSRKRADAVKLWIMTNAQSAFPEERIRVRGYGDTRPLPGVDGKTKEGQAKNRRVDIKLLRTN
jgi:OOP family OmpA-OmpF porin